MLSEHNEKLNWVCIGNTLIFNGNVIEHSIYWEVLKCVVLKKHFNSNAMWMCIVWIHLKRYFRVNQKFRKQTFQIVIDLLQVFFIKLRSLTSKLPNENNMKRKQNLSHPHQMNNSCKTSLWSVFLSHVMHVWHTSIFRSKNNQ